MYKTINNKFNKLLNIGVSNTIIEKEKKRIKVLNITTLIALFHAFFFLIFNYLENNYDKPKLLTLSLEIVFFSFILYFQYIGFTKIARYIFILTIFGNLLIHCNYAFIGYYGEYQYIVIPLFSLFFFDNKYAHFILLLFAVLAFYTPNYFLHLYPEKYFGYINALFLFVGVFLIVSFFKNINEKNEKKLVYQLKENKKIQNHLDEKNKELISLNKFQNHFFVNIAHEIRTPLTILKGQVGQLIKKNTENNLKDNFNKLSLQVNKIEDLLTNIIDIAKIETNALSLNKKLHSANKLLQSVYLEFQPLFLEKNITLDLKLNKEDVFVNVDRIYYERVLSSILGNSYKYTPVNGLVNLEITAEDNTVFFSISDSGIGVPKKDLENIFNKFYQSENHINRASGSGIGLAFSKEVVGLHGGNIKAKLKNTDGLKVTITLNKASITETIVVPEIENKFQKKELQDLFGQRILIVDDNKEMREYLISLLKEFHIFEAKNGEEALKIIESKNINVIVTDFMMPIMDGKELVTELKAIKNKIPIIMLTARADAASKLQLLELGVDDYLTKPFMEEEFLLRLKNILINYNERKKFIKVDEKEAILEIDTNKTVLQSKNIVIDNISNPYFGVAQLSDQLKISERTLYRTLKRETGLSPNNFIRELKLTKVREYINENNKLSLQELAQSVGLTNGTYLNQLFEERFGKSINNF